MGTRVYIGRLSYHAREKDIDRFFRGFGRIRDIMLKNGYGFVEFDDYRDADDAVYELNGKELCGERVSVEHARGPRSDDSFRDRGFRGRRGGGGGGGSGRGLVGLACAAVLLCSILCAACVLVTVYFLLADMESQIEQRVLHRIEASKTSHDAALSDQRALVFGGEGLEPIPSAQKWKRSAEIVPEKKKGQRKKNRKGGKGRRHRKGRKKGKGRGRKGQGRRGRGQGHHRERRQTTVRSPTTTTTTTTFSTTTTPSSPSHNNTSWNLAVFAHLASAGDLNENHAMEHRPVNRRVYSFFLWKRPEGLPLVNAQGISLEYSTVPRTDLVSGISVTSPGLYLIHSQVLVAGRQAGNAFIDCAHQTFVHSGRTGEIKSVAKSLVTQHNLGRSFHHGFDAEKYALDSASHSRLIFLNPNDIVRVGVHQHCSHYWYKQSDVAAYFEIVKL
ncbi:serine/arginine-rich splicing factor 6 [Aplysia californica]|uniref:Serine/arginine-rich splicing factor 6 n=1 Tax=Aplysia californica TaxID=6500 RepID=A0ABM1ADK8_APLCA|nr:serine/arginine-rich splicing factor 6 [Aplysia californica]